MADVKEFNHMIGLSIDDAKKGIHGDFIIDVVEENGSNRKGILCRKNINKSTQIIEVSIKNGIIEKII